MNWTRAILLVVVLCSFAAGWSWLDREGGRKEERWQMRALFLAMALAVLLPGLGIIHTHESKAQRETTIEADAHELSAVPPP